MCGARQLQWGALPKRHPLQGLAGASQLPSWPRTVWPGAHAYLGIDTKDGLALAVHRLQRTVGRMGSMSGQGKEMGWWRLRQTIAPPCLLSEALLCAWPAS